MSVKPFKALSSGNLELLGKLSHFLDLFFVTGQMYQILNVSSLDFVFSGGLNKVTVYFA